MTIISLARFIGLLPVVDEIDGDNNIYQYKEIKKAYDEVAVSSVIEDRKQPSNKYFNERIYDRINKRKRRKKLE